MKLASACLLASSANAATILMTNSAMLGGPGDWNTTVWSVDTVTGSSKLLADTFQSRNAQNAKVCNNVYYSVWADPSVGYGLRALDLATGETTDLSTTSLFHVITCDPTDNSKLLGTASDFTSNDAPFHLKSYDPATQTEVVVGTFPADEVVWGGYDGIFSFTQDGTEVWAAWPRDECPKCSDAKKGGHVHIMDTSTGNIKTSTDITFDGRKKGTPYFLLPDDKRGVFLTGAHSTELTWADLEVSAGSIKATLTSTDASNLWDGSGVVEKCGNNLIAFERGSARYGATKLDEISQADGGIINTVDLLATLDIEGQDETSISALACLTPTAEAMQKTQDDHPHLAQAWQALSSGDGLPNTVGLESYIYEDCPGKHGGELFSETCMSGHVFDYGADNCIKYEVNMGAHSKYTGTYYVKCDSVDCCKDGSQARPDIKKWDIGQAKNSAISHLEATDLDDLDGHVAGADTWNEFINAFGAFSVNYTYYITQSENGDVISHAIDYSAPGAAPGRILYGNFTVKHADELDAFRDVFKAPAACLKNNVLQCSDDHVQKWDSKLFRRGPVAAPAPVVV